MRIFFALQIALLISLNCAALPKASDFKVIGEEEDSAQAEVDRDTSEEAGNVKMGENEEILSGTVRVIRKIDMTEVFFKDLKESYYIPSGSKYSSIYKACEESAKKNNPVSFRVNNKSRRILSLEENPPKKSGSGTENSSSDKAGSK